MLPDQNRVPRPLRVIQTVVGAPNIKNSAKVRREPQMREEMDRVALRFAQYRFERSLEKQHVVLLPHLVMGEVYPASLPNLEALSVGQPRP